MKVEILDVINLVINARIIPDFDTIGDYSAVDSIERLNRHREEQKSRVFVHKHKHDILCKIDDNYILMWLGHMLSNSVRVSPQSFRIVNPIISHEWDGHALSISIKVGLDIADNTPLSLYFEDELFIKKLLIELFDYNSVLWKVKDLDQSKELITHQPMSRVDENRVHVSACIDIGDLFTKGYFEE